MSENSQDLNEQMEGLWDGGTTNREAMDAAIRAWRDDGFGIFMHFSPGTAFQGRYRGRELEKDLWGEWIMKRAEIPIPEYEAKLRGWNPDQYDAEEWADIVAASGCRYFVFTTKHHDGFALFKSEASPYNIVDFPNVDFPDMFGELTEAVRRRGIKPGFYYSHHLDWHEPGGGGGPEGRTLEAYAAKIALPHLEELTTKYGKQHVAWFDCGRPEELAKKCEALVHKNQPEIMVCSRVGGGLGDFSSEGDCQVPPVRIEGPWETCMTLNDHWAWFPQDRNHKDVGEVIRMLASIRSRGGNLLLNIGPDVRGRIHVREQAVLRQLGTWLGVHGDAIYGVRDTPYGDLPWGVCTHRPGILYLHLFRLPSRDVVVLPGLQSKVKRISFLADPAKSPLAFRDAPGGLEIDLTSVEDFARFANEHDTILAVEYEGDLTVDPTPVLDHDFENRFIPALGSCRGAHLKTIRRTFSTHHGTSCSASHEDYVHAFEHEEASVRWAFSNNADQEFFVSIEYANLTGKPVSVKAVAGGRELLMDLPVTVTHDRDPRWFRKERMGHVRIGSGSRQEIALRVLTRVQDADRIPSRLEDGKPGRDHDGFMIKSISLVSLVPPLP